MFAAELVKQRLSLSALPDYRSVIRTELECRKASNPRFSLRALARRVGFSPSFLSDVIHGKRSLSLTSANRLAERLGYTPYEKRILLAMVRASESLDPQTREHARQFIEVSRRIEGDPETAREISLITDWRHFAVLELLSLPGVDPDPEQIGQKLGIPPDSAKEVIAELLQRGLLLSGPEGGLRTSPGFASFPDHAVSEERRDTHRQFLMRAMTALCEDQEKHASPAVFTTITLRFDRSRAPEAQELIQEFRRMIGRRLAPNPAADADSVYCMSFQLFRLDAGSE